MSDETLDTNRIVRNIKIMLDTLQFIIFDINGKVWAIIQIEIQ